jgi:UDP-N-acetylglucosamine diphosphorylase / glucose-1-phosphate thymidylyltransferase / UDP-N-acetylgalactosamine diphosphorylase / glucosamine-1-phosphate N-acetyltransferase / galactosamine-1-phosphate N-acetyltransferase
MQAIILAAGEGTRMRPLTSKRPKVMLPVCGRPMLEQIVLRALQAGADNFVFVVGYGADLVKSHFGNGSLLGTSIRYAIQEQQLGTGHALLAAESLSEERFIVLNGDVLPDVNTLKNLFHAQGFAATAIRVSDPQRYGVFTACDKRLESVVEKSSAPPSNLANAGIYLLGREIFDAIRHAPVSPRGEYELTDGLNALAMKQNISIIELKDWIEIGRPWDILAANEKIMPEIKPTVLGEVEMGATLKGRVCVGKNTILRSGSYVMGPVIIGEGCEIGPNCFIRPYTCLGNNVRVGNAVEIKNSTIMDDTKIGHLSYVGDSVIGSNCNFGAGTIVSNLRHDKANIKSYIKSQREDSGRRKLGVIMGDDVKTGIHTTIYPGTVIESGYRSMPTAELRGLISVTAETSCRRLA